MDINSAASNCSSSANDVGKSSPSRFAPPVKSDQLPMGKKLTKDLVLSKSKGGSLVEIKKIVVWGQKIADCSIVTEIPELEVASMNANKISSLEHFGQCPNLRELFLRSNCIEDIHEIYYLKELPNLQILWLAGNPCTKHPRYRSSVIRNLEQLQKLDDTEIVPAERASSESDGLLFEEPPARGADLVPQLDLAERMRPAEDAKDADVAANATAAAVKQPAEATGPAESPQPTPPPASDGAKEPPPTPQIDNGTSSAAAAAAEEPPSSAPSTTVGSDGGEKPTEAAASTPRPGTAAAGAAVAPLPRYALAEVRTAVLRLIRLLDQESLELVMLTVRSRLDKEAAAAAAAGASQSQQQQPPAAPDMATSFSLDNL